MLHVPVTLWGLQREKPYSIGGTRNFMQHPIKPREVFSSTLNFSLLRILRDTLCLSAAFSKAEGPRVAAQGGGATAPRPQGAWAVAASAGTALQQCTAVQLTLRDGS